MNCLKPNETVKRLRNEYKTQWYLAKKKIFFQFLDFNRDTFDRNDHLNTDFVSQTGGDAHTI